MAISTHLSVRIYSRSAPREPSFKRCSQAGNALDLNMHIGYSLTTFTTFNLIDIRGVGRLLS